MTDHKFTDEDVIKALECCGTDEQPCSMCPLWQICGDGRMTSTHFALSLINRQKADIESLKIANEKMYSANKEQEAEIERLESNLKFVRGTVKRLQEYDEERDIRLHSRLTEKARAEAIKEFAERLKEGHNQCDGEEDVPWLIDKLVKEMTEK